MTSLPDATVLACAALVVGVAFALSAGLIILLQPLLRRYALARPNERSSHRAPTPQGGGIAVCAATIICTTAATFAVPGLEIALFRDLAPPLGAMVLMAGVGALDDIRTMHVVPRLALQILAVALVILMLPADWRALPYIPASLELAFLLIGGVWFINLVNFMDGIDWLTVAEVCAITTGVLVLGLLGAVPTHATLVALALLGSTLGFAPFNRPIARLFLGDVGSLPIGLALAWLLALLAGNRHLTAALLLPLYYVADATLTLLRRLAAGERIWQAHRSHFYQRATDRGFTVLQVVAGVTAVNLGLVALAAATVVKPSLWVELAALAAGGVLVGLLLAAFARGRK
jgi:UDP-N-acetylmuramyl pentapeptide phosphotransferase/UDP-N-acetylglucosamine-1-phosphate transferase